MRVLDVCTFRKQWGYNLHSPNHRGKNLPCLPEPLPERPYSAEIPIRSPRIGIFALMHQNFYRFFHLGVSALRKCAGIICYLHIRFN